MSECAHGSTGQKHVTVPNAFLRSGCCASHTGDHCLSRCPGHKKLRLAAKNRPRINDPSLSPRNCFRSAHLPSGQQRDVKRRPAPHVGGVAARARRQQHLHHVGKNLQGKLSGMQGGGVLSVGVSEELVRSRNKTVTVSLLQSLLSCFV